MHTVYRILDKDGVPCNGRHGDPDELAVYSSLPRVDAAIRTLNNADYAPRSPQPKGRPYSRQDGVITWGAS
jgi:hypothetical protein